MCLLSTPLCYNASFSAKTMTTKQKIIFSAFAFLILLRILTLNERVPNYAPILTEFGIEELQKGHTGKARSHFKKALYHNPHFADAHYQIGKMEQTPEKKLSSFKQLCHITTFKPEFGPATFEAGKDYYDRGQLSEAIMCFRTSLKCDRFNPENTFYLGLAAFKLGDKKTAYFQIENLHNLVEPTWEKKLEDETKMLW
jgi:tetratricopeptide (TPR) repeat protein